MTQCAVESEWECSELGSMKETTSKDDGMQPVTEIHQVIGSNFSSAACIFVPVILIISFLHSFALLAAVAVFFLSLPFLVYGIADRHRIILLFSLPVFLVSAYFVIRILGFV